MPHKLTRRELGLAGLSAAALSSAAAGADAGASTYTGPLDGFEAIVNAHRFDPVVWARARHDNAPLRMTFRASSAGAAERWQKELRSKVTELIGGFPAKKTPLKSQTLEVRDFPLYRREVRLREQARLAGTGLFTHAQVIPSAASYDGLPAGSRTWRR